MPALYALPLMRRGGLAYSLRSTQESRVGCLAPPLANASASGYKKRAGSASTLSARGTVPRQNHRSETVKVLPLENGTFPRGYLFA